MAAQDWSNVKEVLEGALRLAPEVRAAFLAAACGSDHAMRIEVSELLAAHDAASGFLEHPIVVASAPGPSLVGRRIGPYRVLDILGEGGMGTVYRAARDDDAFTKEVALKLVRAGVTVGLADDRFRKERRILARLQHPNIAVLHDGGTSEEGQPYIIMELVHGEPIDQYCRSRDLSVAQRLVLFRSVLAAVQFAHQSLIVHRDLKPGNILVTADGVPKLLDFGIAKLLGPEHDFDSGVTVTGAPGFTPAYASPEQVRGEPITTASDIYSLGVILCELLATRRPYEFAAPGIDEIVRVVCTTDPARPSTLVPTAGKTLVHARELTGDLDTIVLKCLQKDPLRRYGSVQELSEDLRRHLSGLPVLARRDTLSYRASKFVRRHRVSLAASAVALIGLSMGGAMAWRQTRVADASRARAEQRFQDVRRLTSSLLFDLHDKIRQLPGSLDARQALVSKAEEYLQILAADSESDADIQRELASAYQRLGDILGGSRSANLGDTDAALRAYERSLAIRERFGRRVGAEARDVEALGLLQSAMGALHRTRGELSQAQTAFVKATEVLAALTTSGRATTDLRGALAGIHQRLSEVHARQGNSNAAEAAADNAVRFAEAYSADHAEDTAAPMNLAAAYYAHAERLAGRGDFAGALSRIAEARIIQEKLRADQPLNTQHLFALAFTLNAQGQYYQFANELAAAVRSFEQQRVIADQLAAADARDRLGALAQGVARRSLGWAQVLAGDVTTGIVRLREARRFVDTVSRDDPGNGFARDELSGIDYYLGKALLQSSSRGDQGEGCAAIQRTLAAWNSGRAAGTLYAAALSSLPEVERLTAQCTRRVP